MDRALNSLLRAAIQIFRADLEIDLQPVARIFSHEQVTTEDYSVFVRVTGQMEGSVCLGINRKVARHLLGVVAQRRVGAIDRPGILILNKIANRIFDRFRADLSKNGYLIDTTGASTVHPAGMRITTLGMPQTVVTLRSHFGPVSMHVVLVATPVENGIVA